MVEGAIQERSYKEAIVVSLTCKEQKTDLILMDKEGKVLTLTCSPNHADSAFITRKSSRWTESGLLLLNFCIEKGFRENTERGAKPEQRVVMVLNALEIGQQDSKTQRSLRATAILVQDPENFVAIIHLVVWTCQSIRSKYENLFKKRILKLLQKPGFDEAQIIVQSRDVETVYLNVISAICTKFFTIAMTTQVKWVSEQLFKIVLDVTEFWGVYLSRKGGWPGEEKKDAMDIEDLPVEGMKDDDFFEWPQPLVKLLERFTPENSKIPRRLVFKAQLLVTKTPSDPSAT